MDKGLARGSILESCDDLVICCVGELGASLREAAYVVAETLTLLLSAMKKLTGVAESGVGALEMPYEGIPELCLAVDPPPGEVLEPGTCRVGKVQRDALDDEKSLVAPLLWKARR
jgi:hypothetical protein